VNFGVLHADNHEKTYLNFFYWYFMIEAWQMTPDPEYIMMARKFK